MWPRPWGKKSAWAPWSTASSTSPFMRPKAFSPEAMTRAVWRWMSRYLTPGFMALMAVPCALSTIS